MNQNAMYPNYPVYPMPNQMYPPMMPNMPNHMPMPGYGMDKLKDEINDLKRRVQALEKTVNNGYGGTKFNDTNYHVL